ncbi:MAG TPA: TonB-dependent receptor [Acidobacteriaceae bacterium]|nr:TonB-dependent receptor [Acidobacteriaceae bacterium]
MQRMRARLIWGALALLVGFTCCLKLGAQATATGTISGVVTDSSQAVIPGATVTVTNTATGATRDTTTNQAGEYRFDFMPAGGYTVKITKQGFGTVAETVELLVGQTATAGAILKPGATSTTVQVTATSPLVDIQKTSVSQEILPSQVEEMPLVGRDVANLAYLVPGVKMTDSYDPTKNRYAILSVNGDGGRNVNVTVNGIDNKDNTVGGPVMQLPLEGVQEYHISTQRFSAENGRSEGAAINLITKSGSNQFHGSGLAFFRDTTLNTDEKDADGLGGSSSSHPDYSRQFFGGSFGGPIKHDRLFVFSAYEREREHQGLQEETRSYSELVTAKNAGLAAQPAAVIPRPFFENRYNGRLDFTINAKNSAYVHYTSQANNSLNDQSDGTMDLTEGNYTTNHLQLAGFTLNSVMSPTIVNQFTAGFQYWNNVIASKISVPLVTFPDAQFGTNTNVPQQSFQRKWQFRDDFSKTSGKHTFKTGVDYIWNPVEGGYFESNGTLEIDFQDDPSKITTNKTAYPQGFATPGAVGSMSYSTGDPRFQVATKQLGIYGQDDWRLTPRLMVNLGLRWDKDYNMIGLSDVKASRTYQELVAINDPLSNPYVAKLPHDDKYDFSPRVGFAWDMSGKGTHVLRAGYGLYYGNVIQNIPLFMEQQSNPTVFQGVFSISSPTDPVPGTGKTLGTWQYGVSPMPTLPGPLTQLTNGSTGRLMDPNYRNPVTEEFNGGYTWAFTPSTVFEAEYTHVLSLHENKTINIDQRRPNTTAQTCCTAPLNASFTAAKQPVLGSVRNDEAINRSHYDGVNFSVRQRMVHNLQFDANYTLSWAYSYDGGTGSYRNYPRVAWDPFAKYEWGPTANDERHHITVSAIANLPWKFEIAPILQYGSARPYNMTNSTNTLNTGGGTAVAVVVPKADPTNFKAYLGNNSGAQQCFYFAGACTIAKYDPVRGDPFFQLDARLAKSFPIRERANIQLIAQAYNLTNRANYGNDFSGSIASKSFEKPVGFIAPSSTIIPRSTWGELGFRVTF